VAQDANAGAAGALEPILASHADFDESHAGTGALEPILVSHSDLDESHADIESLYTPAEQLKNSQQSLYFATQQNVDIIKIHSTAVPSNATSATPHPTVAPEQPRQTPSDSPISPTAPSSRRHHTSRMHRHHEVVRVQNHIILRKTVQFFTLLAQITIFTTTSLGCITTFILCKYGRNLPDYLFLTTYNPQVISRLYDRLGNPIHDLAEERRTYTHLSDIPPILIRAFLSAEDKNFYSHCGIDFISLGKAIVQNTLARRWRASPLGSSTITQQVAKMFLVGNEHSFTRKIKEAILAFRLENCLSKDKILELYLNQIYLGLGSYGVTTAAQTYFNKPIRDITLAEGAFLASLPKAPSHKKTRYQKVLRRRNWVLRQMTQNKVISAAEYKAALSTKLPEFDYSALYKYCSNTYYVEEARKELIRVFGERAAYNIGVEGTLTIHPKIQALTEKTMRHVLEKYDERHAWRGPIGAIDLPNTPNWAGKLAQMRIPGIKMEPAVVLATVPTLQVGLHNGKQVPLDKNVFSPKARSLKKGDVVHVRCKKGRWFLSQIPEVTGGMIVLDAMNGEVLGMSGGYSFELSQFNCATQALRQPGSTFKPFVYLAALENGFTPNSIVNERPVSIPIAGGGFYTPHNYNKSVYGGPMPIAMGLIKSRNVLTVILANNVGMSHVTSIAKKLGVAEYIPNELCVALGSHETSVMRLAGAYATFFNGGKVVTPRLFLNVSHLFGQQNMVYLPKPALKGGKAEGVSCSITPPYSFESLTSYNAHESGVRNDSIAHMKELLGRCITEGTGRQLAHLQLEYPIKVYGKTGTSNNFKDAWFAGAVELASPTGANELIKYKRPIVFVIFVGHPIPKSMGMHEHGAKVALPGAKYFIRKLFDRKGE
jgi:penicillin-binding protein 1A